MLEILQNIAIGAGNIIMSYYKTNCRLDNKSDSSPLTKADIESNNYIVEQLTKHFSGVPVVSEEAEQNAFGKDEFFLVDPLDGTKSFINATGEFTVNIGFVSNNKAKSGVIYIPTTKDLYCGENSLAYKNGNQIKCKPLQQNNITVIASRSHLDLETRNYVDRLKHKWPNLNFKSAASSLKFCLIAEGKADIYPRFGRTMEWDTAAGQAILQAAGGCVTHINGKEFTYSKNPDWVNNSFVALSKPDLLEPSC